jgi:Dockerin type I domain
MGLMKAGDCDNDNKVTAPDFVILKNTFGKTVGQPGYDARADFNIDDVVNARDVTLLQGNFGQMGAPPIGPGVP